VQCTIEVVITNGWEVMAFGTWIMSTRPAAMRATPASCQPPVLMYGRSHVVGGYHARAPRNVQGIGNGRPGPGESG
jgi:hypothetical protein